MIARYANEDDDEDDDEDDQTASAPTTATTTNTGHISNRCSRSCQRALDAERRIGDCGSTKPIDRSDRKRITRSTTRPASAADWDSKSSGSDCFQLVE